MKKNPNLVKAMQSLLSSDDEVLEARLAEALAEAGVIFACSPQSSERFDLAHDKEIQAAKTDVPSVDEILGTDNELQRRIRLRNYFLSLLQQEGLADLPVEFAQAARNLQSSLPADIKQKMKADREKAESNARD